MKKLLFLGACLVALASQPVKAQTGGADVVIVRASEGLGNKVQMVIAHGNGKTEVLEIEVVRNPYEEHAKAVAEAYQKVFQKLHQEGYRMKAAFTNGEYGVEHSFYFEKKE